MGMDYKLLEEEHARSRFRTIGSELSDCVRGSGKDAFVHWWRLKSLDYEDLETVYKIMLESGVLTKEREGNYELIENNCRNLNPSIKGEKFYNTILYFKRRKDAREFRKTLYSSGKYLAVRKINSN